MNVNGVAFFDLDRTVLQINSARGWIMFEAQRRQLQKRTVLKGLIYILQYEFGLVQPEKVLKCVTQFIRGVPEREFHAALDDFYRLKVKSYVRHGVDGIIQKHRRCGEQVVLLTTSVSYLAQLVAHDLGFDAAFGTRFETDGGGTLTGHILRPWCFGAGKLDVATSYVNRCGVSLDECTFYTDSITDLPLLDKVGAPVAVHPDWRLRRLARQRQWRTMRW